MKPFSKKSDLLYVDAVTGAVIETIKMREFFEWSPKQKKYTKVREYELSREPEVNPTKRSVTDD